MKKTLGILLIIFTFFICNSVVYGETERICFTQRSIDEGLGENTKTMITDSADGLNYSYNLYTLTDSKNNKNNNVYCIEAGVGYADCDEGKKYEFTKTTYNSNTTVSLAFLYIINKSNFGSETQSLALRLFYSYKNDFSMSGMGNYILGIEDNDLYNYLENQLKSKVEEKNLNSDIYYTGAFGKTSYFFAENKACTNQFCIKTKENSSIETLENAMNYYKEAINIYDKSVPSELGFIYDKNKSDSDNIIIKSKYPGPIYLDSKITNKISGSLSKGYYYYKIPKLYIKNNKISIYLEGAVTIYSNTTYQDMLVLSTGYTQIDIPNILQCNVSPELNPKSDKFNKSAYINAHCLCSTYDTTKKYNKTEYNAISKNASGSRITELQTDYINMCPPPCSIISTCSNLDGTCDDVTGTLETKVSPSMPLTKCLASTNLNSIEGHELLYKTNRTDINEKPIYCLEKIELNLGTKRIVNNEGGTFGVYPYIKSTLTECASSEKTIDARKSFYNILNDSRISKGYYSKVTENSSISIKDNSTTEPKTFSLSPSFEKLDKSKLTILCEEYSIDITILNRELSKYVDGISSVFDATPKNEMLKFDFDGSGEIDLNDVNIVKNIVSVFINPEPGDTYNIIGAGIYNTVYLYFLPKFLYTSPILGVTSLTGGKYSLGYKYALSYGLNLKEGKKISDYTLTATLYRNNLTNILNTETCSNKETCNIYYKKNYCIDETGKNKYYSSSSEAVCKVSGADYDPDACANILCPPPATGRGHCPLEYRDTDGSLRYYSEGTSVSSACDENSKHFNETTCKSILKCYGSYKGSIDYWYRPITLNDVFPNTNNDISMKELGKTRVTGENWSNHKGRYTQKEIEAAGEGIYNNNNSWTGVDNDIDTKNPVYYKVTLTPQNMKAIRDYNDGQETTEGYADFNLTCTASSENVDQLNCRSTFLTDLITKDSYGEYIGTWKDLSNARKWKNYTDGTAWK